MSGQSVKVTRNSDDAFIDPPEADLQRELIDGVNKLESATADVKYQIVTISPAAEVVAPAGHGCKVVKFWTADTTVSVGDEDSQPTLLIQNVWLELAVNNVGNLRFTGSAGGEVINIVSMN